MLRHPEAHVDVAGPSPCPPVGAGALDPHLHAVVDAGGDRDRDRPPDLRPPVAPALVARGRDDLAGPAALRARPRGHDRAEDAPGDLLHVAGAAAPLAARRRRPRLAARSVAPLARRQRVDLEVGGQAEHRLLELEVEHDVEVLTPPDPGRPAAAPPAGPHAPAEEHVEDVAEVAER